jgi:hypothetical protein
MPANASERQPDRRWVELIWVIGLVIAADLWSAHVQHYQVFRLGDADEYFTLAEQLAAGRPVTASAPFASRVLTPWLVATCCPANIQQGFLIVNIIAGGLGAVVLAWWLRRFVGDWRVRVLVTAAYIWEWHGPVRIPYYSPAYVDGLVLVFLPLGLIFVERTAERPSRLNVVSLIALTGVGVLAREIMFLVPVSALLHRGLWERTSGVRRATVLGGPIAAAIAATWIVRRGTHPRVAYSFAEAVGYQLTHKPLFSLGLTWFMTFGPVIAIVLYDWRNAVAFLRRHQHLAAYLVFCAGLAYVGGTDTERLLIWAAPVVYVLIGRAIERNRTVLAGGALASALLIAQLISERVFWGIPDQGSAVTALADIPGMLPKAYSILNRLFVIDDFYWNLWSNFGSRPFHLLLLMLYVAFSAVVVVWMRFRSTDQDRHPAPVTDRFSSFQAPSEAPVRSPSVGRSS